VHHAPGKVNVSNNNVNQFLDVILHLLATQLPLLLLGLSQPAVFVATMWKAAQGYSVHANIDAQLGLLNYILVTPEQHRLHHSTDPSEAGHYAADLPIWDLLFGTFRWAPGRAPDQVGLVDPRSFPSVRSVLANQLHPFRRLDSRSDRADRSPRSPDATTRTTS
jgi:sterol desaturase/sphingolipid hydroxylase (fatty acid hydroxylase superfamily)